MIGDTWGDLETVIEHPRRRLARVAVFAAIGSCLEAAVLVIVARVGIGFDTDDAGIEIAGISMSVLRWVLVGCVLLLLLAGVHMVFARVAGRFSADVLTSSRTRLIGAYLRANFARQSADSEGVLQHAAGTLAEQSAYLALTLAIGAASLVTVAIMVAASAAVSPVATAGVAVLGLLLFFGLRPIAAITRRAATRFVRSNAEFGSSVAEQSQLALETGVFGVERQRERALDERNREAGDGLFRSRTISLAGGFAFRDAALLVLLAGLAVVVGTDRFDIEALGPVLLLNVRALSFAQGVQSARQVLSEHAPNLSELADLIRDYRAGVRSEGTTRVDHVGRIVVDDIGFTYPDAAQPALTGASVTIEPGSSIGVIGPSGGGKSTFAQLVLGVRAPTSGSITADGTELAEIARDDWTRLVAAVPQEARLIEGTIADNVRFFRPGLDESAIRHALDLAGFLDDVDRMPDGLSTKVGARGIGVSGGQRQRIAIARALVAGAEMLVLDEPTSALDATAEEAIAETIERLRGDVTLIVIAHRPRTVEQCERLIELRDGTASIVR